MRGWGSDRISLVSDYVRLGTMNSLIRNLSELVLGLSVVVPLRAATLLLNPGFESDPAGSSKATPGWQSYGANVYGQTNAALAHGGTNFLKVYQAFTGSVNFAGIYQDYISGPGASYAADGWACTAAGTRFPGEVLVDYVRIYELTDPLRLAVKPSGSNLLLSWPTNVVCHLESQTNSRAAGLRSVWASVSSNASPFQVKPSSASALYRLASP
jgi:hypothetical protein